MSEEREQLEARIAAYIDGELPEAEAARLEVFLANTDPKLAEQVIGMLSDKHKLRELPRGRAPLDLAGRVMEQVERATLLNDVEHLAHPQRSWWQSRVAIAAAVVVLVGGFGCLVVVSIVHMNDKNGWEKIAAEKGDKQVASGAAPAGPVMPDAPGSVRDGALARHGAAMENAADPAGQDKAASDSLASARRVAGKGGGVAEDEQTFAMAKETAKDVAKKGITDADELAPEKADDAVLARLNQNSFLVQNAKESEALKQDYAPADTANKAIATLTTMNGSMAVTDPIVVTLVARNDQDPAGLRNTLASFMAADPNASGRQVALQKRYANNSLRNNGYTGGMTVSGGNPGNTAGTSNTNSVNNGAAAPQVVGNSSANNSATNSAGTLAFTGSNDNYQIYNKSNPQKFDQIELNGNVKTQSQMVTQNNISSNPDLSAPYRVVLREDQLKELTGQFHVYSLSCGRQAFVITDFDGRLAKASFAEGGGRGMGAKADGVDNKAVAPGAPVVAKPAAATAPAAMAAGTPAPVPTESVKSKANETKRQVAGEKPMDDNGTVNRKLEGTQSEQTRWIDCVIKMEPRPGQYNLMTAPNSAATQPAK